MGKYTTVNGATNAVKQFKKTHPHLTFAESTTRKLRDRYNNNTKQKRAVDNKIPRLKRGRSLLLGAVLDEKMKHFSLQLRKKGGVVNTVKAVATAKALITRSSDEYLKLIDLESTTWIKSLFRLMGFCKCAATTSKPEIPELVKREAKLLLQHQVANLVEKYAILHLMIMIFDETLSKFAPVSSRTLDNRGTSHVAIAGMSYIKTEL